MYSRAYLHRPTTSESETVVKLRYPNRLKKTRRVKAQRVMKPNEYESKYVGK